MQSNPLMELSQPSIDEDLIVPPADRPSDAASPIPSTELSKSVEEEEIPYCPDPEPYDPLENCDCRFCKARRAGIDLPEVQEMLNSKPISYLDDGRTIDELPSSCLDNRYYRRPKNKKWLNWYNNVLLAPSDPSKLGKGKKAAP